MKSKKALLLVAVALILLLIIWIAATNDCNLIKLVIKTMIENPVII